MHEIAIAQKIIKEAQKQGAQTALTVEVGELAEITPTEVEETLQKMTNWNITVKYIPSKIQCACGYTGSAHIIDKGHGYCVYNCPQCEGKPTVQKGGEIKITEIG